MRAERTPTGTLGQGTRRPGGWTVGPCVRRCWTSSEILESADVRSVLLPLWPGISCTCRTNEGVAACVGIHRVASDQCLVRSHRRRRRTATRSRRFREENANMEIQDRYGIIHVHTLCGNGLLHFQDEEAWPSEARPPLCRQNRPDSRRDGDRPRRGSSELGRPERQ